VPIDDSFLTLAVSVLSFCASFHNLDNYIGVDDKNDAPLRSTIPPIAPLSAGSDHSADISELKTQITKLTNEVNKLKKEIDDIWKRTSKAGIHR
jgi:hypothetical protein